MKLRTCSAPQFLPAAQTTSRRPNAALRMQTLGPCFHKWSRSPQDARRPRAYVLTYFLDIPLETLLFTVLLSSDGFLRQFPLPPKPSAVSEAWKRGLQTASRLQ